MRIKGSVVVITGASSGIGRAAALRFAKEGADVVLAARRAEALTALAAECEKAGVRALAVPTDVSDVAAVDQLAERAVAVFGRIDVWLNDAAVGVYARFDDIPPADFQRVIDVNVMGYVNGARAALRQMRRQGRGVLINVASVVAEIPQPWSTAYTVSKAAVRALSLALRTELRLDGDKRIHVCTVLPATVDTPWYQHAANYTGHRVGTVPPVYGADRVARAIVDLARSPQREVTVGAIGKAAAWQHRAAPRAVEATFGTLTDKRSIRRSRRAAPSSGNLYRPSADPGTAAVSGGWGGGRKTAVRRLASVGALAAAGLAIRRALR
ncbi:SDR family NAD(P)-dependent oxidoreductase [Georgenia yuyongxinii]|uniref:SDR family NAD(P)-dependent oxidoreductase n=1 Tax=Georgenia yuyongxinii TaxID=2589797 RepID=A0A5B8BYF3_9MICO|nr:SDR family oxidoreductase [Georgenia yuyongxinii]QDC23398.1 SDR family NAD(P)-dependent oxidoreductase [Georgenia yuyongxinii]